MVESRRRRSSPRRTGLPALTAARELVLVALLALVEPGLGIQCFHCVTNGCYNSPDCNTESVSVCNLNGNKGVLTHCADGIFTCKEETFFDSPGVYRHCGEPGDRGAHCDDEDELSHLCTCGTDACNTGLVPVEPGRSGGVLWWWWLMAVPAAAAVLLTLAAVLVRRRRQAGQRADAAAETGWAETRPAAAAAGQDPLL